MCVCVHACVSICAYVRLCMCLRVCPCAFMCMKGRVYEGVRAVVAPRPCESRGAGLPRNAAGRVRAASVVSPQPPSPLPPRGRTDGRTEGVWGRRGGRGAEETRGMWEPRRRCDRRNLFDLRGNSIQGAPAVTALSTLRPPRPCPCHSTRFPPSPEFL